MLLIIVVLATLSLLLLITWAKLHPFVALIIVSLLTGLATGMPLDKIVTAIKDGVGSTLSFLALILALGTMQGKLLAESGGAERIARTLIRLCGEKRIHWAMMIAGFAVGIPVYYQVGFVLLIPLVFTIARTTGVSLVTVGIPLLAGLSTAHGLMPPHPAAMTAVGIYHADVGLTIFYAVIVGVPTAILAGPVYGKFIGRRIVKLVPRKLGEQLAVRREERKLREDSALPGVGNTLFAILLPVLLMLVSSFLTISAREGTPLTADLGITQHSLAVQLFGFFGDPVVALLVGALYAFYRLGYRQGFTRAKVLKFTNDCLGPTASILLTIGVAGAFNNVLKVSGIGQAIADRMAGASLSPLVLGWLTASLIRAATGSSTVSLMTAAGIVAPVAAATPGTSPELLVLAAGAGSLNLSHVNDSGSWMIKEYIGMTVKETFYTWTVMETLIAVIALPLILLMNLFLV
jgi:GntP family gluconate:H+ symporter